MDIIYRPHFFGGKNTNYDEIYIPMSLKSTLKFNPNSNIYFISNDKNFIQKNFPSNIPNNLKCFTFDDFESENTNIFNNQYVHLSHNQYIFEKYAILSYIYIYNLTRKYNIKQAIIVETDILVFANLTEKFTKYYDLDNSDAILALNETICCSYITQLYLETFTNSSLKFYSDNKILECLKKIYNNMKVGGICDMTINKWISDDNIYGGLFTNFNLLKKKIKIVELSTILADDSFFDNYLNLINYDNGMFDFEINNNHEIGIHKKIYNINNEPFFKYNDKFVKVNSIHFQGPRKLIIPEIYNTFFNVSNTN
jgi:hypothetical protein